MEVDTNWGKVITREAFYSAQTSHCVLLKDNMHLKPLFTWLPQVGGIKDGKVPASKKLTEAFKEAEFNTEVRIYLDERVPMIVLWTVAPLRGDYATAIKEYFDALYAAMYKPGVYFY